MPNEKITLADYPERAHWTARATVRRTTCRLVQWQCPDCGTENTTRLIPSEYHGNPSKVQSRCGRCHGPLRTLITGPGYTIEP